MKTILLILMLALTGWELPAQVANPANPANPALPQRPPRYGLPGAAGTPPRYQPGAPGAAGQPGNPGGAPGGAPGGPLSSSYTGSSSFAKEKDEMIEPGFIQWEGVDLNVVLDIYAKLVHRILLRGALPDAKIILNANETPLTKSETVHAIEAVLALNGISLIPMGEKFVKVMPSDAAGGAGGEIDRSGATNIPPLGTYITHVTQLKYIKPSVMLQFITPFAKLNSIIPLDENGILVIRDYAENVKRMLEMIEQVDVSVPAEYISEVIPIRYAKVDDIANALNALGGSGGGATVSVGTAPSTISGVAGNRGGFGGTGGISGIGGGVGGGVGGGIGGSGYQQGGIGGSSAYGANRGYTGQTTPNGTPSGGATSFQQRLNSIINGTGGGASGGAAGSQQPIQLFGQTKIIPNESSSSLLIYATRADMDVIKGIIGKLDVPLAQVLVEAVIIDVTLGNTFNFGVSAAQNPSALSPGGNILGGGGVNNASSGSPFINFVQTVTPNKGSNGLIQSLSTAVSAAGGSGTNSQFANNLPGGASYFANLGPMWDVAVTAAETDSHANIIQRPRIMTQQAKPAQFFVGDTVPYVTSSYGGYSGYSGNSYSQLSVGVELDVTPFINPDGVVSMDIQQEIDDLNGYTAITGVGNVPNTIKRTLNASITVRDRDTIMLGGFIKSDKSVSKSGVPFLQDIPLIGNLFTSRSDSKDREELIVLMRPTVLQTPELAAKHTVVEEQRLPGVSEAAAQDGAYERSLIDAQRKREQKEFKRSGNYEGFFAPPADNSTNNVLKGPSGPVNTNRPAVNPGAGAEEDEAPVPPTVHPQGTLPPTAPAATNNAAPLNSAAMQQKAAAALAPYLMKSSSTNAPH
jgi:general secretion pathway protein D